MRKKNIKVIAGIVLFILLLLFAGMSYVIGLQVFEASTQVATNEETQGVGDAFWEIYDIDYAVFTDTYRIEKIELESSFDGHLIPGDYIYAGEGSGRDHDTVVLIHGAGGNRLSNYPLAEYFLEKGFNVVTYDQRSSGENTAPYTTFGYWEKYDLIDITQKVIEWAPDKVIGYWGTSFGGATAGQALGNEKVNRHVDFAILDCPVSSMKDMVRMEIENMDAGMMTGYIVGCGNLVNRLKLGFSYGEADVCGEIADTEVSVLIINSQADTLTPEHMGKDIYEAIGYAHKELWTVEDSGHTEIWLDHHEDYISRMNSFISRKRT